MIMSPHKDCPIHSSTGRPKGWRPWTLQTPAFLLTTTFSIALIVIIEVIARYSARNGALVFLSKSETSFPFGITFAASYLPTIIFLVYKILWDWIDIDMRRIEPWFALSSTDGAMADDCLMVDYPGTILGWVTFDSTRRKHWRVGCTTIIMFVVIFMLTPLSSVLIARGSKSFTLAVSTHTTHTWLPMANQTELITSSVMLDTYASVWLNKSLPAFTSFDYALKPFSPDLDDLEQVVSTGNLTGITMRYWIEFECNETSALTTEASGFPDFVYESCLLSGIDLGVNKNKYAMKYDYILKRLPNITNECPDVDLSNLFYLVWLHGTNSTIESSALYCHPTYHQQLVKATVSYPSYEPISYTQVPGSPVETILPDYLNITAISILTSDAIFSKLPDDGYYTKSIISTRKLPEALLGNLDAFQRDPLPATAIGLNPSLQIEEYQNQTVLREGLTAGHKALFAVSVATAMGQEMTGNSSKGSIQFMNQSVRVNRKVAWAIEVSIGLIMVVSVVLSVFLRKATSKLLYDPSSISRITSMVENKNSLAIFSQCGHMSKQDLARHLRHTRFRLTCRCESGDGRMSMKTTDEGIVTGLNFEGSLLRDNERKMVPAKLPWIMQWWFGMTLIVCFVAIGIILAIYVSHERQENGLPVPFTNNSDQLLYLQILTNYLPTALAATIDTFITSLTRRLTTLEPFLDVSRSHRHSRAIHGHGVSATLASRPNELIFFGAVRSKHIILGMLCLASILGNVLSSATAGIISTEDVRVKSVVELPRTLKAEFNASAILEDSFSYQAIYNDPGYVVRYNLSHKTPMRPWSTQDQYFLPVTLPAGVDGTYVLTTSGLSIDPNCSAPETATWHLTNLTGLAAFNKTPYTFSMSPDLATALPTNTNISETLYALSPSIGFSNVTAVSWANVVNRTESGTNGTILLGSQICSPRIQSGTFNVSVDSNGYVRKYLAVKDPESLPETQQAEFWQLWQIALKAAANTNLFTNSSGSGTAQLMSAYMEMAAGNDIDSEPAAASIITDGFSHILKSLVSAHMSLTPAAFSPTSETTSVEQTIRQQRLFMDPTALVVVSCILIFDILALFSLYCYLGLTKIQFPRIDGSLGSLLAYVAMNTGMTGSARDIEQRRFVFGEYQGTDGKRQVGIEEETSVEVANGIEKVPFWGGSRFKKREIRENKALLDERNGTDVK